MDVVRAKQKGKVVTYNEEPPPDPVFVWSESDRFRPAIATAVGEAAQLRRRANCCEADVG